MSESKVLSPMPGDDGKDANNIINKRLADLAAGKLTPDELKKAHMSNIAEETKKATYPTLIVDLPSKGLIYPPENPLSLGYVEMKYMTAREEDILTTEAYIKKGVVLDKLFQSLIVSKIDYDTMLIGDRDAIMIAARVYGYGAEYKSKITTPSGNTQEVLINLEDIPKKEFPESLDAYVSHKNLFDFTTSTGHVIKFKLLTNGDQKEIQDNLKKVRHGDSRDTQLTTRLYQMIVSVDGNEDRKFIKTFVENDLLALDSRKFREYVAEIQPGVDMSIDIIDEDTGEPFRTQIAIGLDFFWTNV